jgi:hypothetical protein
LCLVWWVVALSGVVDAQQQHEGYLVWRGKVIVEGRDHWLAWDGVAVGRQVGDDGVLRPRFLRRGINAALNAPEFDVRIGRTNRTRPAGIVAVGASAPAVAAPIIDGDDATYWQPPIRGQNLEQYWVEIDLGRGVIARRIVVRFARDGDPFLMFRVLASDGEESFGSKRERRFFRVGQQAVPNKSKYEFSYEIPPQRQYPEGVVGEAIQHVRLEMLATDGPRGRQVSESEYQQLPPQERGAIDHYLRTVTGREIRVVSETYDELSADERGPIRYYRWERPRLAEVEVLAEGDNVIGLTQRPEFAVGEFFDDIAKRFITDGLFSSSYFLRAYDPFRNRNQVLIDLGARFWLERVRLVSSRNPPTSYQLRISDGSLDAAGQPAWTAFPERLNREVFLHLEETFPQQPVRLIELRRLNLVPGMDQGELAEVQGFGEGFVSDVTLTSPLIRLGARSMFSRLNWEGEAPLGTSVEVRTRTGDALLEIPHYYNRAGVEITQPAWEGSKEFDRGEIRIEELTGPDWSPWSSVYQRAGQAFQSPMPRRLTQIQVRLRSFEPLRAAELRQLSLDLAAPLVEQAVGEVWPVRGIVPGRWTTFRLYVKLRPAPEDAGISRLRLRTTSSTPIRLQSVRAGDDVSLRFGPARTLYPGSAGLSEYEDGSLELQFAETEGKQDVQLELVLEAKMFLPGTTFLVELHNDERPALVQLVDPGPASALVSSNSLIVSADLERATLLDTLRVEPAALTPNGDGINDEMAVLVTVYQVAGARPITVGVYDLSGRQVRDLSIEPDHPSGEHRVLWDGRDGGRHLVPPGTYLLVVELDTDEFGVLRRAKPIGVVY